MGSYHVRNWHNFQHYKSGRGAPPWIKVYRNLLNDKEWHELDPGAAKTLLGCWILAAESDGQLPTIELIAFRLRIDSKLLAKQLRNLSHWIIPNEINNDSNVLASGYQLATPETETETETETHFAQTQAEKPARSAPKSEHVRFVNGQEDPVGHFEVEKAIRLQWLAAYPAVQVGTELEKAAAWVAANPTKRKKDWRRFLNNWMSRAQERAR